MQKKSLRDILIFLFSLLSVSLYLTFFILSKGNIQNNISDIILTYITSLVTILSITISLMVIGLQFISDKGSTKLLPFLFNSKQIIILVGLYLFTILFDIIGVNLTSSPSFLVPSTILLIFCLFYLVYFLYFIVENLNEEKLIEYTGENTSLDIKDTNYSALKELCLGYIMRNEVKKFYKTLNILNNKLISNLKIIKERKISINYDYDMRHREIEEIIRFFLGIYKQLFHEISIKDRGFFLWAYLEIVEKDHEMLCPLLAIRPYKELMDHFFQIGYEIIKKEYSDLYLIYWHSLRRICLCEFKNLNKETLNSIIEISPYPKDKLEQSRSVLNRIMQDYFLHDTLNFLFEITKKCLNKSEEKNDPWFSSAILGSHILPEVIKLSVNDKTKIYLVNNVLSVLYKINEEFIKKDLYNQFYFLYLYNFVQDLLKKEDTVLRKTITSIYIQSMTRMLEIAPFKVLMELAINGRFIKDMKGAEDSFKMIIQFFDYICNQKIKNKKYSDLSIDYLSSEINSIIGSITKNNLLVHKLKQKYKLKENKYRYIMGLRYKKNKK